MPFVCCRLTVVSVALLLIAGCGGSGNGSNTGGGGQSSNPTTVTFTFQGPTPTAVAASIGAGAYTAETLSGNTLTLSIPSGTTKFAVAYVCPADATAFPTTEETIFEATTTDGTSFSQACASSTSGAQEGTFSGSVDANAIADASWIDIEEENSSYGARNDIAVVSPATTFSLSVPIGNYRVMVGVMSAPSSSWQSGLLAARNFASQAVPGTLNGGDTVVLGAADETTAQTITYNDVPPGFASPTTTAYFAFGGGGNIWIASGATNQYPVLPAAATESGDYYFLTASALSSGSPEQSVEAFQTSSTAGPVAFSFTAPWSYAGPTAAALPAFDMNYSGFAGQSGVYDSAMIWWGYLAANFKYINILATENYQDGSTTLAVPDLSSLSGFLAAPSSGTEVDWKAMVTQSSTPMSLTVPSNSNGSAVSNQGSYLEP